jgi:hypothetical protein
MFIQCPSSVKSLEDVDALAKLVSIMFNEGKSLEEINNFFVKDLNCIDLEKLETKPVSD